MIGEALKGLREQLLGLRVPEKVAADASWLTESLLMFKDYSELNMGRYRCRAVDVEM